MSVGRYAGALYEVEVLDPGAGTVVTVATPVPEPEPAPEPPGPLVVLGDSWTAHDWTGDRGWPVLVGERLGLEVVNLGYGGAGYVHVNDSTIPYQAARVPARPSAVVVLGSLNDIDAAPAAVRWAARAALTTIRALAPGAPLLVLGPQWAWRRGVPGVLPALRDEVGRVAGEVGARWGDPFLERWFADRPDLILPDGMHPDREGGQQYLAQRIAPHLEALLRR